MFHIDFSLVYLYCRSSTCTLSIIFSLKFSEIFRRFLLTFGHLENASKNAAFAVKTGVDTAEIFSFMSLKRILVF